MSYLNYEYYRDNDCLPEWYRSEHYEYSDSMYNDTLKVVKESLLNRFFKIFA